MTDRYKIGMLAYSKAGHDSGRLYVIANVDGDWVYLTDGNLKGKKHPKKKKKKHIQLINEVCEVEKMNDVAIKTLLKNRVGDKL